MFVPLPDPRGCTSCVALSRILKRRTFPKSRGVWKSTLPPRPATPWRSTPGMLPSSIVWPFGSLIESKPTNSLACPFVIPLAYAPTSREPFGMSRCRCVESYTSCRTWAVTIPGTVESIAVYVAAGMSVPRCRTYSPTGADSTPTVAPAGEIRFVLVAAGTASSLTARSALRASAATCRRAIATVSA